MEQFILDFMVFLKEKKDNGDINVFEFFKTLELIEDFKKNKQCVIEDIIL